MRVVTEEVLRACRTECSDSKVRIDPDAYLTQSALDYIREQDLDVLYINEKDQAKIHQGEPETKQTIFVDRDGNRYRHKPEHMTHLHGRVLVHKAHPRIALRGKVDLLQSKILEVQLAAFRNNQIYVVEDLEEILKYIRQLLASEVRGIPLEPPKLFGLNADDLRERSQNPQKYYGSGHVLPSYNMGEVIVALNMLRTQVRETELCAICAFPDKGKKGARPDIVLALNRISSAVYIIMCRTLANDYAGGDHDGRE